MRQLSFLGYVRSASICLGIGFANQVMASPDIYHVSTRSELLSIMSDAQSGDKILLAAGDYGVLDLVGVRYSSTVTIRSADPANPAEVDKIDLTGASHISLESLHVNSSSDGDAGSKLVRIVDADNISFIDSEVNATVDGTTDHRDYNGHFGVYVKNATDVTVANNKLHDVRDGVTVIGARSVQVSENHFDFIGHDTIKVIATHGILIENNTGPAHVFAAPNAHKDYIQFGGGDSADIVIRGNVYLAGNNLNVQGIFMDDATYTNVLIENNVIYTGMLRGISITAGSNIIVQGNTILNVPGGPAKATVITVPSEARLNDNISSGVAGMNYGTNIVAQHDDPGDINFYGDLFTNAFAGMGATLDDLRPIKGSPAAAKGASFR